MSATRKSGSKESKETKPSSNDNSFFSNTNNNWDDLISWDDVFVFLRDVIFYGREKLIVMLTTAEVKNAWRAIQAKSPIIPADKIIVTLADLSSAEFEKFSEHDEVPKDKLIECQIYHMLASLKDFVQDNKPGTAYKALMVMRDVMQESVKKESSELGWSAKL